MLPGPQFPPQNASLRGSLYASSQQAGRFLSTQQADGAGVRGAGSVPSAATTKCSRWLTAPGRAGAGCGLQCVNLSPFAAAPAPRKDPSWRFGATALKAAAPQGPPPARAPSPEPSLWNATPLRVAAPSELASIVPGPPSCLSPGAIYGVTNHLEGAIPYPGTNWPQSALQPASSTREGSRPPQGPAEALVARHLAPRWGQEGRPGPATWSPQPASHWPHCLFPPA